MSTLKLININQEDKVPALTTGDLLVYCNILGNVSTSSLQNATNNCLCERLLMSCVFTKLCQPTDSGIAHDTHLDLYMVSAI